MKKSAYLLLIALLLGMLPFSAVAEPIAKNGVLAHWRLQNREGYYTGSIDADNLTFTDLSGNGNDLVVRSVGNGNQLDIFSWDTGVDLGELKSAETATALMFNNSLAQAKSVDPYDASQNTFSGAYVSGKYLETVENAPLNSWSGRSGWTVEIVFKISPEWNNLYNRYTGLFSRQGIVESQNEPALSLALSEVSGGNADGAIGEQGTTGLQYIHVDPNQVKTNEEFAGGIYAGEWVHYMVACNGLKTSVYCNGVLVRSITEEGKIASVDPSFGWEIGVGRKILGSDATSMNQADPEGLIRRLFCGSISEIRVSEGALSVKNSLLHAGQDQATERTEEETVPQLPTDTSATVGTSAPVDTVNTGCGANLSMRYCVPFLAVSLAALMISPQRKAGRVRKKAMFYAG
ncbi:MAG: hypothetical protein E7620_02685 [Ruminococcaceae bacterium]|nr:hypothetical protein [Oscillospiraceae bacterium]